MRSRINKQFRDLFAKQTPEIRRQAREAYRQFRANPFAPGLNFEPVNPSRTLWSARINAQFRAVGIRKRDDWDSIVWFWIGSHNAYENLLNQKPYRS